MHEHYFEGEVIILYAVIKMHPLRQLYDLIPLKVLPFFVSERTKEPIRLGSMPQ